MGLYVSFDAWKGPYGAFHRWRNHMAQVGGYPLKTFKDRYYTWDAADIDWENISPDQHDGVWEKPPEDPLMVLIVHSDCEGEIPADLAEPLADRLEGLFPSIAPDDPDKLFQKTVRFVAGLRKAANEGLPVKFG